MKIDSIFDEGSSKEDALLIKDNLLGVFDGFNSLNRFKDKEGKTGGLIASTIAKNVFSKNTGVLKELAIESNKKIGEKMLELDINTKSKNNLWGTIFAAVSIEEDSIEWAQIADSLILLIYKDNSFKLVVENYDHDAEVLEIWKKLAQEKKENIRDVINEKALVELRSRANITYGVLNGEKEAVGFIKSGFEKLENLKHILLFTDGVFLPKEDPSKEDDWDTFTKLFLQGGLNNIKEFVRGLDKDDPKCWKYPRFKQYDDIAAIAISF